MHTQNLEQLATWLEAGAPHVTFDMLYGAAVEPDCGTTCCMAGAAFFMKHNALNNPVRQAQLAREYGTDVSHYELDWQKVQREATEWLDVDPLLFRGSVAATPAQAAVQVRKVMKGQDPWV
jgi:hypothetical protein